MKKKIFIPDHENKNAITREINFPTTFSINMKKDSQQVLSSIVDMRNMQILNFNKVNKKQKHSDEKITQYTKLSVNELF